MSKKLTVICLASLLFFSTFPFTTLYKNQTRAIALQVSGSAVPATIPMLVVLPEKAQSFESWHTFVSGIYLAGWNNATGKMGDLDPVWDVSGFNITYKFNTTLLRVFSVIIDPDGWFAHFWPQGLHIISQSLNSAQGTVKLVFQGVASANGTHTAPFGQGRIAAIGLQSIYDSTIYPPPSCTLSLTSTTVTGFPHPERPEAPWNGSDIPPQLTHKTQNATYTAFAMLPGRYIDIYTQYADGLNGKGPGVPSDMFWPQKEVTVYATVTYNFWPEQQKDVSFAFLKPNGTLWSMFYNRTGSNGITWVRARFPWPSENPESDFGKWKVVATVDVAGEIVNDTMEFEHDYRARVWRTFSDKPSYNKNELMRVSVDFGTMSRQTFPVLFAVTAADVQGVPFAYELVWMIIGGTTDFDAYKNGNFTLDLYIPLFARAGLATIYVSVLSDWPWLGGDAYYPTRLPETVINVVVEAS